jgi:hypothetical protein
MRSFYAATVAILALGSIPGAFAQTVPRPAPNITETQDAGKKAEYLESFPYRPCPSKRQISERPADVPWFARPSIFSPIRPERINDPHLQQERVVR